MSEMRGSRDAGATAGGRQRHTIMFCHAHPDDETIGTGGVMAKAVADGHRAVLVTCTRGEMGEIVVPEMDTPENHRRLGEIRAAELEAAMGDLGIIEWENLGYRDSDMMGRIGNDDPRCFWRANLDEAIGRLVWLVRVYRPDVITTYNDFGGYGHPDHIRTHQVAVGAFERAGDPRWYPEQLAPEHGGTARPLAEGGLAPWEPKKLYEQAWSRQLREGMAQKLDEMGIESFWSAPKGASPDEIAQFEEFMARATTPDEQITTRVDVADYIPQRFEAMKRHVTQIKMDGPLAVLGPDGWKEFGGVETFVLRASRVSSSIPETDLFTGID